MKTIQQDLKSSNLSLDEAIDMAQLSSLETSYDDGKYMLQCCQMSATLKCKV